MIWSFSSGDAEKARRAREDFVRALQIKGGRDRDYSDAELVFGELVGNVVRHAPGAISVRLDWTGEDAVLTVQDSGKGFELPGNQLPDETAEGGRGLYIIRCLAKEVTVRHAPNDGMEVCAVLAL
jgi:anti-sigma regulatory factor (Ser/Thr protein kinase)